MNRKTLEAACEKVVGVIRHTNDEEVIKEALKEALQEAYRRGRVNQYNNERRF